MGTIPQYAKLSPAVCLCFTSIEAMENLYREWSHGAHASTLVVSIYDVNRAYQLMLELKTKYLIVPVPGFPRDFHMLCGEFGIIRSEV